MRNDFQGTNKFEDQGPSVRAPCNLREGRERMSKKIASRILFDAEKLEQQYKIVIDAPFEEEGGWSCKVRIENAPDEVAPMKARGVDSYQALAMAFSLSQGMAHHLNGLLSGRLRFIDADDIDLKLRILNVK